MVVDKLLYDKFSVGGGDKLEESTVRFLTHLSMLTLTTPLTGSDGDSVGVSNLAKIVAPMVLRFKLANDDLIPIPYKPFNLH